MSYNRLICFPSDYDMCVADYIEAKVKDARWKRFGVGELDEAIERATFPSREREIVRHTPEGRVLAYAHWGLVPSWAQDARIGRRAYNARSETVAEKPMFRAAFKSRRCLLIGSSYCEWVDEGGKSASLEFAIDGGDMYAYAGLWEKWGDPESPYISCTMLTCPPNSTVEPFNDRMPVILSPEDYDAWLDPQTSHRDLLALCLPLDASRVSVRRGRDPRKFDREHRDLGGLFG